MENCLSTCIQKKARVFGVGGLGINPARIKDAVVLMTVTLWGYRKKRAELRINELLQHTLAWICFSSTNSNLCLAESMPRPGLGLTIGLGPRVSSRLDLGCVLG